MYDGSEDHTVMEKILVAQSKAEVWEDFNEKICDLIAVATVSNVPKIYECLHEIVPEYTGNQ